MAHRPNQRRQTVAKEATTLPRVPETTNAPKKRERKTFDNNRDKGLHVGKARMERALAAIGAIRPLANRKSYELTDQNRAAMLSALEKAVAEVKEAFSQEAPTSGPKFAFE